MAVLGVALAGCGSEKAAPERASAEITGVEWVSFQGMSIPTGDQGPKNGDAVAPSGYERSPAGAALAAMSAVVRSSVADDDQWPAVAGLIAPGEARDRWAVNRSQVSITAPASPSQTPKIVGYRVSKYTKSSATVQIITRNTDRSLAGNNAQMVWGGDWYLQLPSDNAPNTVTALSAMPADTITLKESS